MNSRLIFSTLGCPELTFDEILQLAKENGISALEIRGILDGISIDTLAPFFPDNREETKRKLAEAGIAIHILGCSAMFHNDRAEQLAECRYALETATEFGIPYIRIFGDRNPDEETFRYVTDGIRELCEIAKDYPVKVLMESHGEYRTADLLTRVFDTVNMPNFGMVWDIGHTHRAGEDDETFARRMLPYIHHVHIRDEYPDGVPCRPGNGVIDIVGVSSMLTRIGYTGLFSLEWEKRWMPDLAPLSEILPLYIKTLHL